MLSLTKSKPELTRHNLPRQIRWMGKVANTAKVTEEQLVEARIRKDITVSNGTKMD